LAENRSFSGSGRPRGGCKNIQRAGGRSPPPHWMVSKPPGAAQTPKPTDFQPNPKPPPSAKPRDMALELVSGADFLCKLMCGAGPVDLRGSRGPRGRPDPENDRFSAKSKPPSAKSPSGNRRKHSFGHPLWASASRRRAPRHRCTTLAP